jgi:hypothetical protein
MKYIVTAALFALTANTAFATGQQLPPGANPPGNGHGCLNNPGIGCGPRPTPTPTPPPPPVTPPAPIVVPISGTSNSSANAVAQAAALAAAQAAAQAAANATAVQNQNQNQNQNLNGSVNGTANTHGGNASTHGGNAATTGGNAATTSGPAHTSSGGAVTNGGDSSTKSGDVSQNLNGSAGNNRLTTGDSAATSKSGVNNSGNSHSKSEGGTANATGNGAGNTTTLSETTTYEAAKFPPQLPAVFLTMSAPCMGSAGGGAGSGVTVLNLAFTYSDSECKDIRRVMTLAGGLWSMNMRYSAFTVLCSFQKYREIIPTCSQPFPVDDPKQLWGYSPVVVDTVSEKARAERAEAELAKLKQSSSPLLTGITKADLDELKASLAAAATVRVEVPTDKVEKKRVSCKVEEFTDTSGLKVKMCRGPAGSYEVTTVRQDRAVGTATGTTVQNTETKK